MLQHQVQTQILRSRQVEIDTRALVATVQTAQVEIIDAAKVAGEIESLALDLPQPARQSLQVQPILAQVIARRHVLGHFNRRVTGKVVRLPVQQKEAVATPKHQIHEAGEKALLAADSRRYVLLVQLGKMKLQLVDAVCARDRTERITHGLQRRVQSVPQKLGDLPTAGMHQLVASQPRSEF